MTMRFGKKIMSEPDTRARPLIHKAQFILICERYILWNEGNAGTYSAPRPILTHRLFAVRLRDVGREPRGGGSRDKAGAP
jgi:hypothetical protein